MSNSGVKNRFRILDQLRGFFIIVIIIDHLSRWPSLWGAFTGKALLWVTAAEGFVIISGFLVGYVRGFKNQAERLSVVSGKLIGRALLLYIWAIISSLAYTAFMWYVPLPGGAPGIEIAKGEWGELITKLLTFEYTYVWVHFLSLYALFLAASPIAVWLLRRNQAWLLGLISFALLALGWLTKSEILQWQFLFFIPAIAGYYLDSIINWWQHLTTARRRVMIIAIIGSVGLTVALSIIVTFYPWLAPRFEAVSRPFFEKDSISLVRAFIAFLWFTGLFLVFMRWSDFITKRLGWLLEPIGQHSLTAYIIHGVVLCLISAVTVGGSDWFVNSLLGAVAVLLVWLIIKLPGINRVIPR